MSRTPKRMATVELTNATAEMYESPGNTLAQVAACTATNKTGTARTVTVTLIPSGGTAVNLVYQVTIPPNQQIALYAVVGQVLEGGDAINAFADANSAVDFVMSGFETY